MSGPPLHSTPEQIPSLTGARGLAAVWVLLFHLWQTQGQPHVGFGMLDLTPFLACGYFGVDLFFVLSGYLLAPPFIRARMGLAPAPHLGLFWEHRCRRVLPAYVVQLAVLLAIASYQGKEVPPQDIASHLTLTFNLFNNTSSLNPVYWSMPVEWNFYILLPLLALGFSRHRGLPWIVPAAIMFSVGFRILCVMALNTWGVDGLPYYRWIIQLPARLDQFSFGMGAAWLVLSGRGQALSRLAAPIGLLILIPLMIRVAPLGDVFAEVRQPWLYYHCTLVGLAMACLILALSVHPTGLSARLLASPPAVFLGTISYSLYLWHFPILDWLQRLPFLPVSSRRFFLAALITCIVGACISYYLVEARFLKRGRGPEDHCERPANP